MGVIISDLPEAASVQTTDVIIISGAETKKISYANLLAQLKTDLNNGGGGGTVSVITRTWRGLSIRIASDGNFVTVGVSGRTNATIQANNTWTTVGTFADDGIKPSAEVLGYLPVNSTNSLRFRWATDGTFQVGFSRVLASGAGGNISSGMVVDMQFCFSLK
jgi:hypothetical protein